MKSYVTLEQKICPVCGESHDAGIIEKETITGYAMCEEHSKLIADGFCILVEAEPNGKEVVHDPSTVKRTGRVMHMKQEAAERIFDTKFQGMAFIEEEAFNKIERMIKAAAT